MGIKIVDQAVTLVDHMGSDLSVVNAARVSFAKESDWERHEPSPKKLTTEKYLKLGDEKLIKYLAIHNHWSPFGHATVQFRIKAPIFVARQLVKHQIGLCWNEVSRRYVSDEPEFYFPKEWRGKPINAKQGSSDEIIDLEPIKDMAPIPFELRPKTPEEIVGVAVDTYNKMIEIGVAPEQARMILPQNMMTEWIWTGSVYAFARIAGLRIKPAAQLETREVAEKISKEMQHIFPVSWKYLT